MKSDVIHISGSGSGISEALKTVDRVIAYNELGGKDAIHLRLLAEEMTGMMKALTGEQEGDFWIESQGGNYELHLLSQTVMNSEKREKLIAVSTSGKNDVKGFSAKLKSVFQAAIATMDSSYSDAVSLGALETDGFRSFSEWTLTQYKSKAKEEEWDELEKSVVAKLANEIRVRILGSDVEMIIEINC